MAPAQLAHDMVSIVKEIANFHRMVTTWKKKLKINNDDNNNESWKGIVWNASERNMEEKSMKWHA